MKRRIAIFLKGYPRLSETFIAQEIALLEKRGFDLELISLRRPTDRKRHPVHDEIKAPILYLPEYVHHEIARCFRAWRIVRLWPSYKRARAVWLRDLRRDPSRNRVRRFVQALVAAAETEQKNFDRFYAHFIHTPASVARYGAILRGVPFCVSAHAKDIWTSPSWELREKLAAAQWTVTCTKGAAERLKSLAAQKEKVHLLYHGLDLRRFPPFERERGGREKIANGSDSERCVKLLSVGRMVEKKGFDVLIEALALLPADFFWNWTHIAGGPLKSRMEKLAHKAGLDAQVAFLGAQSQERVLRAYREADLFVLPCRIAADGDRDGLPNVIVEAQSQSLAVVSSPVSGIPELIEDGVNGSLVPPDDPRKLAQAIEMLGRDAEKRRMMGTKGAQYVRERFDAEREIDRLFRLFESPAESPKEGARGAPEARGA